MSQPTPDFSDFSMLEIFRVEAENQSTTLSDQLLKLEGNSGSERCLEALMRAAHSLKGAAQIVQLPVVSRLAHALEDCFVSAQRGQLAISRDETDLLLQGVDFFKQIAKLPEAALVKWEADHAVEVEGYLDQLQQLPKVSAEGVSPAPAAQPKPLPAKADVAETPGNGEAKSQVAISESPEAVDGVVRVTSATVNRLLGLAGESLVESRRLQPLTHSMQRLKRLHLDLAATLGRLRESLATEQISERASLELAELTERTAACQDHLLERIEELDSFDRRTARVSNSLYQETLRVRMRPFRDGVSKYTRMVRDLARNLNKEVRLEIIGDTTQVDREILEKLDAPLTHLIRNALDHGCEPPADRERVGKPREAVVKLEARHSAGMLLVTVADDGRGVDANSIRDALIRKKLVAAEVALELRESELMEFLFLPGFSTKEQVTEISGRGVGLDVVRDMVAAVRGKISIHSRPGLGIRFQMQLPISLAVMRSLLVEIAGEPYALPLSQIAQAVKISSSELQQVAGREHCDYKGVLAPLVSGRQLLGKAESKFRPDEITLLLLGERTSRYGLVVDKLLGERELVVQALDSRLGKIRDVNAAALMEDGAPVLILDVEDLVRSMEKAVAAALLPRQTSDTAFITRKRTLRILVVDDSITVREMHRKLLTAQGYAVELAVDGMDGWNAVRAGEFDLVISDVDMPRMDGLEMVALIKRDPRLRLTPVLVVSHKDREQDRQRGLAAGADEYMTKSGFRDETLLEVVRKLTTHSKH